MLHIQSNFSTKVQEYEGAVKKQILSIQAGIELNH